MQVCFITPINYLERFAVQSNMHLLLAHITLESKEYREFYKDRSKKGDYVIMDNGNFELEKPLDAKDILSAAEMVGAKEVILPDYFFDAPNTIKGSREFVRYLKENNLLKKYRLNAVVQGAHMNAWRKCFEEFFQTPEIDVISFSYKAASIFKEWGSSGDETYIRPALLHFLHKTYGSGKKDYHALGMANNPIEINQLARFGRWMRSIDSSTAFVHGMRGIRFDEKRGLAQDKVKDKLDFNVKDISEENLKIVQYNMDCMKKWAR